MTNLLPLILDTPWKATGEIKRLLCSPFILIRLKILGVEISSKSRFYGAPRIFRHQGSRISIGQDFENRNWFISNPLGIIHPTIITTWSKNAVIKIGQNVGISGGSICAATNIQIGDNTLIGANCTIIDTDFHPIRSFDRRQQTTGIKSQAIKIGKNVFIGMNSTILKGVTIGDNSVIGASSIVAKDVPSNSIFVNGKIKSL